MAGKRHHTIPRFLLKGFASSRRGDEAKVWMYRKGQSGIELNIDKVSVEKNFYGTPEESDLDDKITAIENEYAPLVENLRACSQSRAVVVDARIPDLVTHLIIRTRQLRQSVIDVGDSMVEALGEHLGREEVVKAALFHEIHDEERIKDQLRAYLVSNGLGLEHLDLAMAQFKQFKPYLASHLTELMPLSFMRDFQEQIDQYTAIVRSQLPMAFRAGFIESLARNMRIQQSHAAFGNFRWFVFRTTSPILLGDTVCLFETTGERRFKPVEEQSSAHRVYLPLACDRLLVGTPFKSDPRIDLRLLNKAIARCSYEFFVSSQVLPVDSPLIKGLGVWSGILSKDEGQAVMADVKRNLFKD